MRNEILLLQELAVGSVPTPELVFVCLKTNHFVELECVNSAGFTRGEYSNRLINDMDRIVLGWYSESDVNPGAQSASKYNVDRAFGNSNMPVEDAFLYASELKYFRIKRVFHSDDVDKSKLRAIYD